MKDRSDDMNGRKGMRKAIICLSLFILFFAANVSWAQETQCWLSGWVNDKDKNGTNVRSTPSVTGKVVTVFPFASEDGELATVEIIGYENGWLRIRSADTVDGTNLLNQQAWISAKLVTVTVETKNNKAATLYTKPKRSAIKAGTVPNSTPIAIKGFDCFGYKVSYKGRTGWLSKDDVCGNPVTTCP